MSEELFATDAEQSIIATCMAHSEAMLVIVDKAGLTADHFSHPLHQKLFELWRERAVEKKPFDKVIAENLVRANSAYQSILQSNPGYFDQLNQVVESPEYVSAYIEVVMDCAERRRLRELMDRGAAAAYDSADVSAARERLIDELSASAGPADHFIPMDKIAYGAFRNVTGAWESKSGMPADAVASGLKSLDAIIRGFRPGQLCVVAGRPGMGKSLLGLDMARRVALQGHGVLFFTLEMLGEEHFTRLIGRETKLAYDDIDAGEIDELEYRRARDAAVKLSELPIEFEESGMLTPDQLRVMVRRRMHSDNGPAPKLIVIDHMGLIKGEGRSDYERVSDVANQLKGLAQSTRLPVLALAQLNREVESRDDKRPRMSDLRGSGRIEENAHKILLIYRDAYYAEREAPAADHAGRDEQAIRCSKKELSVVIAKNRGGRSGAVELYCDVATGRIDDLATVNERGFTPGMVAA